MDYFPNRRDKERFAVSDIINELQCTEKYRDCEFVGIEHRSMGYDTAAIIKCGETLGHLMIYVHGNKNYPYMKELPSLIGYLRAKEARRLADEAAVDASFAWFYR